LGGWDKVLSKHGHAIEECAVKAEKMTLNLLVVWSEHAG
jgi:hypothetical protein